MLFETGMFCGITSLSSSPALCLWYLWREKKLRGSGSRWLNLLLSGLCGCVDVCAADDGMLMVGRDERRRDWAFELVSGLNAWAARLGDA